MEKEVLNRFNQVLTTHYNSLSKWVQEDSARKKIHLGNASRQEVTQVIDELQSALDRIKQGDFGKCTVCNESVEIECLEMDCTAHVCLDHYSGEQLRALERDLELAGKVQRQLLPPFIPAIQGFDIATHFEPAQIVGGDYYDFFTNKDNDQGVIIADVMGKGLPASMLMSNLQASLRILGPDHREMHDIALRLNDLFRFNLKLISFITMFLMKIDIEKGTLKYCNAGHNPAILYKAGLDKIRFLNPTGPAVGITVEGVYTSEEIQFEKRDLLLLYTDGLTESHITEGFEFDEKRLVSFIRDHHNKPADTFLQSLLKSVRDFSCSFDDDVTLIVIKKEL